MNILVTGGSGYIGSHTIIQLIQDGHTVVIVDNLVNSSTESMKRVEQITETTIPFYECDLRDKEQLDRVFVDNAFDAVIHFAGLKAVGESVQKPLYYYDNNLGSTMTLLDTMAKHNVKKFVFSSSATVYGSAPVPYIESHPAGRDITNPYGRTKYMIEEILSDIAASDPECEFTSLRYFNPIGAHQSGRIGEDPDGIPNNLMPFIAQVAVGKRDKLSVFGNDYDTIDGTGVRDYIHVVDLALGHLKALDMLAGQPGLFTYNLGTGQGNSVLEVVAAFERAGGRAIPLRMMPPRPGDAAVSYADPTAAARELGWTAQRGLDEMVADTWRWQMNNPDGYRKTVGSGQ